MTLQGRTEAFKTLDILVRTRGIVERSMRREGDKVKLRAMRCCVSWMCPTARLAWPRPRRNWQARPATLKQLRNWPSQKSLYRHAKLATEQARLDAARAVAEQIELELSSGPRCVHRSSRHDCPNDRPRRAGISRLEMSAHG